MVEITIVKNKKLNDVRLYYLKDHVSIGFHSIDVVKNTSKYNIDLLNKLIEMIPVSGEDHTGWINKVGPCKVTSNDIKTTNKIAKDIHLFDLGIDEEFHVRINYIEGTGKDHARFVNAYAFIQDGNDVKVFFNI